MYVEFLLMVFYKIGSYSSVKMFVVFGTGFYMQKIGIMLY